MVKSLIYRARQRFNTQRPTDDRLLASDGYHVERLEDRNMLAGEVSVSVAGDNITIVGDNSDNKVLVTVDSGFVRIQGVDAAAFGSSQQVVLDFGMHNGCAGSYDEDGYRITAIDSGHGTNRICLTADLPDLNGVLRLMTQNGEDVRLERIDGEPFDLLSLDVTHLYEEYQAVSPTGAAQDLVYSAFNPTNSFSGSDWRSISWFELRNQDIQPPPPLPQPVETTARIDNIILQHDSDDPGTATAIVGDVDENGRTTVAAGDLGNLTVKLNDGDDTLWAGMADTAAIEFLAGGATLTVGGNLKVITGRGNDSVEFARTLVAGKTSVVLGDGDDHGLANQTTFGGNVKFRGGGGDDILELGQSDQVFFGGRKASIKMGGGNDTVLAFDTDGNPQAKLLLHGNGGIDTRNDFDPGFHVVKSFEVVLV